VQLPWSGLDAHPLLVDWAHSHSIAGAGRRAVVVGCGLGADAEYLARLGFDITGFDISATAVRLAGQRFPQTTVHHRMANVLELPTTCRHAFVLLVEIITVQALPDPPRRQAIANIARLVAAGRTLLVYRLPPSTCCSLSPPPSTTPRRRPARSLRGRYGATRLTDSPPTGSAPSA
jgi:SAM-dependent methyltransferase